MGVFIKVAKHWCFSLFSSHPTQVQSPRQSSAVVPGIEAGSRLWNLNQSLLQFDVARCPNSHFSLSSILLSR